MDFHYFWKRHISWNSFFTHISNEILTFRRASWSHNFIFTHISNDIAPFPGSKIRGRRVERCRVQDSEIRRALGPWFSESRKHWDAEIRTADIRTMHRSLMGRPQNVLKICGATVLCVDPCIVTLWVNHKTYWRSMEPPCYVWLHALYPYGSTIKCIEGL